MTNFENRPEELSQPSINIQNASNEDIEGILDVQSQNLIVPETDENQDQSKQSGFLVNPVSAENLTEIIEEGQNHILKVAKENGQVIGYLLSYDAKKWMEIHPEWLGNLNVSDSKKQELISGKVMYGRHIAIDNQKGGSGIGKNLLDSTLQEATKREYKSFVVEVAKEPVTNERSTNFVQSAGFASIGQSTDEIKRVWTVFSKELAEEK